MLLPHDPPNRLAKFFPVEPPEPPLADRVLDNATGLKLELLRFTDDDGDVDLMISYEVHGSLPEDQTGLLAELISRLSRKGGGA